jgi:hypothetical protein
MTIRPLFTNNAATALVKAITPTDNVLQITAGTGNYFPQPTGGNYFYLTLIQINNPEVSEIVKCIDRTGDYLTVERGQEGTQPQIFNISDNVELRITAASLNLFAMGGGGGGTGAATQIAEFTATQGQTVFSLPFTYVPNQYNLAVFVNGSKQIADLNYSEASETTIAFLTGLNVGDKVEVIYNLPIAAGQVDASNIRYNEGDVGAVNRTVQVKLQESVSVLDFGADSTGTTNSSVAIQQAINTGKKLYFPKGTYLCNVTVNSFFEWQGDGAELSILKPYNTSTPVVTDLYEPSWIYTSISDIGFVSTGTQVGTGFCFGNPTAYTVGMEACGRVIFNRCAFTNFNIGVYKPYGNIGNVFNSCSWVSNNYGYFAQSNDIPNPTAPIMHSGADTFNGGESHSNLLAAFLILNTQAGGGQWTFNQTVIEYNSGFGIYADFGSLSNLYSPITFNEIWQEGNASASSVTIKTTSGTQTLTPSSLKINTTSANYDILYFGQTGLSNGIGTTNPQAPLGIWGNQRAALNLIGGGYGANWTSLGFSSVGSESTIGASITSNLVSGTNRNLIFTAGTSSNLGLQPNGSVLIGSGAVATSIPSDGANLIYSTANTVGTHILDIGAQTASMHSYYVMDAGGFNSASAGYKLGKITSTGRSINAGGTINASGADYAEYMVKAGDFTINKGDICGIDKNGKLTNVFADAISFVVKSTSPSYVGGDTWGYKGLNEEYTPDELENIRETVDRIAFAGQVPVNVNNAIAGQYIIPINDNGLIKGEAVNNPTFEQYQIAVGKVISVDLRGKPTIIVKVA